MFVTHGENEVAAGFAQRLVTDLHRAATAPYNGEVWDLTTDTLLTEGNHTLLVKEQVTADGARGDDGGEGRTPEKAPVPERAAAAQPGWRGRREAQGRPDTAAYAMLREALNRMTGVVNGMEGSPKKAQNKLAAAIFGLVNKYGRR